MLKIKLILISAFVLFYFHSSKAQYTYELCENLYENYYCELDLYESKEYELEFIEKNSGDLILKIMFSAGTYQKFNDTLILNDLYSGYEIRLIENKNLLIVTNGIGWLINKKFIFESDYLINNSSCDICPKTFSFSEKEEIRVKHKNLYKTDFLLNIADYYANEWFLELKKDSTFNFKIDNILFSDGKWIRDGNILILNDSGLNTSFYMLIGNNCLIPNQLFDLDSEMIFKIE